MSSTSSASRPDFWRSPFAWACLVALCFLTVLFRLGSYGLVDADEGRYAEIPREMLVRGDWVTPTINGIKFFDKPPLTYWSVMGTFSAFGVNEFAARLAMALFALAGVGATYALGRRAFGARAGWLGAAILTTTFMWPVMGRVVITDTPLASMVACALAAWWLGHSESNSKRRALWFALFWIFSGLGVLAKGPVALMLAFGAIGPYLMLCRPAGGWKMGWASGASLLLLVAAPWFVLVQLRNPEFGHLFWYKQNFQRFTGGAGVPDHWEAWHYFFKFLPIVVFPWSLFFVRPLLRVPTVFRRARSEASDERARAAVFLVCSALFTLLFFSASKSKIVTYILPMLPPGCVLLGAWFDARWHSRALWLEGLGTSVGALALGIAALSSRGRVEKLLGGHPVPSSLFVAGAVALCWMLALHWASLRQSTRALFSATAGGFALLLASIMLFWSAVGDEFTLRHMMEPVRRAATSDTRFASVGLVQSLSFYSQRIVLIGGGDINSPQSSVARELRPGWERMTPGERANHFYNDADELKRLAQEPPPLFVVTPAKGFPDSHWSGVEAHLHRLDANARYALYGNDAAKIHYLSKLAP